MAAINDTDIQSPGIHVLFGLAEDGIERVLNDYRRGRIPIVDGAHDATAVLGAGAAPADGGANGRRGAIYRPR